MIANINKILSQLSSSKNKKKIREDSPLLQQYASPGFKDILLHNPSDINRNKNKNRLKIDLGK